MSRYNTYNLFIIEKPEKIARCCDGFSRPFDNILSRVSYNIMIVYVRFILNKSHRIDSVVLGNIIYFSYDVHNNMYIMSIGI